MPTSIITYCCRDKDPAGGLLPASDRYLSPRIKATSLAAESLGASCHIMSGLYGIIEPSHEIPDYDHFLTASRVSIHAELMMVQLQEAGVSQVVFVTRPLAVDPGNGPYCEALALACHQARIDFRVFEMDEEHEDPLLLANQLQAILQ